MSDEIRPVLRNLLNNMSDHRESLLSKSQSSGFVRFSVPPLSNASEFALLRNALFPQRASYVEAATPRTSFGNDVFSSTNVPPSRQIAPHNENSYATGFPGHLLFYCFQSPDVGGATPICDARKVLKSIDPSIVEEFQRRGWALVRNYSPNLGRPWQEAFGTDDRSKVDEYCSAHDIVATWSGDRLKTRQVRPVTINHPVSGETSWFNHVAFWHGSQLSPEIQTVLTREHGQDWPFQTTYGDGGPISNEIVDHLAECYRENLHSEPWQSGDLLLVDNLLAAHAREPFQGPRSVMVAMGTPLRRDGLNAVRAIDSTLDQ